MCSAPNAKYSCPNCWAGYCSIACYKVHKENCQKTETESSSSQAEQQSSEDTKIHYPSKLNVNLERIGESRTLKKYLADPYIQGIVNDICQSDNPIELINRLKNKGESREFFDELLIEMGAARRLETGVVQFIA